MKSPEARLKPLIYAYLSEIKDSGAPPAETGISSKGRYRNDHGDPVTQTHGGGITREKGSQNPIAPQSGESDDE